ncbi:MAG: radical SAM/SPASM domain-containing protein [Fibrobacterota bacterium]
MNIPKKIKIRLGKEYRKFFANSIRRKETPEFPERVCIQTVSYCNSGCVFCPHPSLRKKLPQGKMEEKLFCRIIDECSEYKIKHFSPFLMNEPLMDPEIFKRTEYIRKKIPGAKISLNTNASLLDRVKAEKLVHSEIDSLSINIQGTEPEDFSRLMRYLDYEKTMENIKRFMAMAPPFKVDVNVMAFNSVKDRIDQSCNFWEELGIVPSVNEPYDCAGNITSPEIKTTPRKEGMIKGCWNTDSPFYFERPIKWLHILFNGDVVICCLDWKRNTIAGNAEKTSIKEIWHNKKFNAYRDMVYGKKDAPPDFLCRKCAFAL